MLLSPILTVMSIFRLKGGQLLSRGYVANFSQDLIQLCKILPRKTNELPILIVKKIDQNNQTKDFIVNRNRVTTLLNWLYHNNEDWKKKGIEINIDNINNLPINGIPTDLNEISEGNTAPDNLDQIIIQTGPNILEKNIENDEFIQTFVESDIEEPLQIDRIGQFLTVDWPAVNPKPINEFEYDGLCSLAFPAIFPYGTGDPTKKARRFEISETDGFNHLLKYATKNAVDNQLYYPFVQHSRFKFWAYDRIRRHRALNQAKIYLKQNIGKINITKIFKYFFRLIYLINTPSLGDANLTVKELKDGLTNGNGEMIMKRMSAYSANIIGSNSYWYMAKNINKR